MQERLSGGNLGEQFPEQTDLELTYRSQRSVDKGSDFGKINFMCDHKEYMVRLITLICVFVIINYSTCTMQAFISMLPILRDD